jgi:hypothetical protein
MMLSDEGTASGDLLAERAAAAFDVLSMCPTSTPVTQITYGPVPA